VAATAFFLKVFFSIVEREYGLAQTKNFVCLKGIKANLNFIETIKVR